MPIINTHGVHYFLGFSYFVFAKNKKSSYKERIENEKGEGSIITFKKATSLTTKVIFSLHIENSESFSAVYSIGRTK
jgi:hypothetical protein